MSLVKRADPAGEQHAAMLMGVLMHEIRDTFAAEDWAGLRQSHFRVVFNVPPGGISVTDLALRVPMSKQGCGQFVTHLRGTGHLRVAADPDDRRVRRVYRTALGERTVAQVTERILRIEQDWAGRVGEVRYRVFREVLGELARTARVLTEPQARA